MDRRDRMRRSGVVAASAALWTPAQLFLGGITGGWWDFSDLATLTLATGVSQATDKSGGSQTLSQATAGRQPAYSATGWNGVRPAAMPDGVANPNSDYLTMATGVTYNGANGISFYCAMNRSAAATTRTLLSGAAGAGEVALDTSHKLTAVRSGQAVIHTSTAVVPAGYNIVGMDAGTNLTRLHINGAVETQAVNPAFSAVSKDLFIQGQTGNNAMDAPVGEVLITSTKLIQANWELVEGYMGWRWGTILASGHRFENRAPVIGD